MLKFFCLNDLPFPIFKLLLAISPSPEPFPARVNIRQCKRLLNTAFGKSVLK